MENKAPAKKMGIIVAVVLIALIGGVFTVKALERVGQGRLELFTP